MWVSGGPQAQIQSTACGLGGTVAGCGGVLGAGVGGTQHGAGSGTPAQVNPSSGGLGGAVAGHGRE